MTCEEPGCDSIAAWTCRDGAIRCTVHALEWSPLKPLRPPGIVAAVCPSGWRRDPVNGRPVLPCLAKLLFPCAWREVPTRSEITKQVWQVKLGPLIEPLVLSVLTSAALAKRKHDACMDQYDERAVSNAVDAALRSQGEVRIVKTGAGWEEVGDGS